MGKNGKHEIPIKEGENPVFDLYFLSIIYMSFYESSCLGMQL